MKEQAIRLVLPDGQLIDVKISDIRGPTDVLSSRIIRQLKVRVTTDAPDEVDILILDRMGQPTEKSLEEVAKRRARRE
jgi:hypothetical protein